MDMQAALPGSVQTFVLLDGATMPARSRGQGKSYRLLEEYAAPFRTRMQAVKILFI